MFEEKEAQMPNGLDNLNYIWKPKNKFVNSTDNKEY